MLKRSLKYPNHTPFSLTQAFEVMMVIITLLTLQEYINHLSNGFQYAFSWDIVGLRTAINYLLWLGVIPIISKELKRIHQLKKLKLSLGLRIGSIIILFAFAHRLVSLWLFDLVYSLINGIPLAIFRLRNISNLWIGIFASTFQAVAITGVIWAIKQYKRSVAQQKALVQAELKALKMQLNPHFLFNTFHSIAALIDIDTEAAQLMLSRLGILLRTLLEKEKIQKISLKEEVEFIRHYLGIEQIRFQDRLTVSYEVHPETLNVLIPAFILQPIVENALKHGISRLTHDGKILIKSEKLGRHTLKLMVEDNGSSGDATTKNLGVGTENVKQRLMQLYGESNFSYEANALPEKGYRVTILIPIETITEESYVYSNPDS